MEKTNNNVSIAKKFMPILIGIVVVFFLIIIIAACAKSCSKPNSNFKGTQSKMVSAAKSYYKNHGDELPSKGESKTITANELAEKGVMKPLSKYLKDTSCEGKVNIYNNGGKYLFVPDLVCAEYKTEHLKDAIIKDSLVDTNTKATNNDVTTPSNSKVTIGGDYISGLYLENDIYIFKGKDPNNYFSLGGLKWRILSIEADGTIRLLKINQEKRNSYWDTKYNSDANRSYGVNDYKNSKILEKMNSEYEKFKDENKTHLAPHSVCVGRRSSTMVAKDRSIDCSEILTNQYIGLPSISDYANASLDENCNNITDGACSNYNYLTEILVESWTATALADNTYSVYFVNGGIAMYDEARKALPYNWVIAIKGDELYVSGNGTSEKPYTIGK